VLCLPDVHLIEVLTDIPAAMTAALAFTSEKTMNPNDDALRALASRLGVGKPGNPHSLRETLEASLVPMIRCALRSGAGLPPLVQWVRRHQPVVTDPVRTAPAMARQLCARLLEHLQPRHAAETVVSA
jgi:hypothetical protein